VHFEEGTGVSAAVVERYVDVVALVVKAPRTVSELEELSGLYRKSLYRLLDALEAEGLVEKSMNGRKSVWRWAS
jgi:DNA-binding IclR family transcriptional regulator